MKKIKIIEIIEMLINVLKQTFLFARSCCHISPIYWTKLTLSIAFIILSTIYIFTYLIDPFGNRAWIVDQRFKPIVNERSEKYHYIFTQANIKRFDCLILGSSRAMKLDPSKNSKIANCYNFSFSMASNNEKLFILNEWIKYKKPSAVYIGIDFLNFHRDIERPDKPIKINFINGHEGSYLSNYALRMAIKSLENSIKNTPSTFFESNGVINYYSDDHKIDNKTYDFSIKKYQNIANIVYKENFINIPYVYTQKSIKSLQEIKKICDTNHIKLTVFIPPEQLEATKKIINNPILYEHYKHYKYDIVKLFGSVYDFSGDWPENKNQQNFYDVWHYRSLLGDKMLSKFSGQNTFGTVLNKENIGNYLIHFRDNISKEKDAI